MFVIFGLALKFQNEIQQPTSTHFVTFFNLHAFAHKATLALNIDLTQFIEDLMIRREQPDWFERWMPESTQVNAYAFALDFSGRWTLMDERFPSFS